MNKYIFLLMFLIPLHSISCEEVSLPTKMEWNSSGGSPELFLSVPEHFDGSEYERATLSTGGLEVQLHFSRVEYLGWVSTTIKGSENLLKTGIVTVYYRSLGRYQKESNSFAFLGCLKEAEIKLKM